MYYAIGTFVLKKKSKTFSAFFICFIFFCIFKSLMIIYFNKCNIIISGTSNFKNANTHLQHNYTT